MVPMLDSLCVCIFLWVNGQVAEEAKPRQAVSSTKFDKQHENKGSPILSLSVGFSDLCVKPLHSGGRSSIVMSLFLRCHQMF